MLKLSFFGGAQEVTGANYLLETDKTKILIDCGMFQCPQFCSLRNREEFEYDPSSVDALFVTHAHIDHLGRVPKLVAKGFKGTIYSSPPTKDFGSIMLEDSLGVLEKEAKREGLDGVMYELADVTKAMKLWKGVPYAEHITIGDMDISLHNAGHILGSAMIEIVVQGKKFLFTGDLGNSPMPLLAPPEKMTGINNLIIESAYGDREHEDLKERKSKLEVAIEDVVKRGGVLLIPSFALERTQELLYEFNDLVEHGRIPRVPFYIDSPLAIKATAVYKKHEKYFNKHAQSLIKGGDDLFNFPGLHMTLKTEESIAINDVKGPKVILAGAGMMHGGRIIHHAARYLSDPKNMILFIGYQAAGSPGRKIIDGEKSVRFLHHQVPIRAEIRKIGGYSAHADSTALLDFISDQRDTLERVFVVQGEPKASYFLAQRARDYLGINAVAPAFGDEVTF
jgi:metallo-beta-lactamase family protein